MSVSFNTQYGKLLNKVFPDLVQKDLETNQADPVGQARSYCKQGKVEFTLAYLLCTDLPDGEKREVLAAAFENSATRLETKSETMSAQYKMPFPLIQVEVQKDRRRAEQVRAGQAIFDWKKRKDLKLL